MVYRYKILNSPPTALLDPKWDILKSNLLIEKNTHDSKSSCYRDTTLNKLLDLYKNKCAICERSRGEELEVDHYRPYKKRCNTTGEIKYNQPGYYWLTYEWSNLIPLCSKCNNHKSNKFPLREFLEINRVDSHLNTLIVDFNPYDGDWLQQFEKPLIVNPEKEKNPENNFSIHKNGKYIGRTDNGAETILICKLNRNDLIRERQKVRYDIIANINFSVAEFEINRNECELKGSLKNIFRNIYINCHKDAEFSLLFIYIYKFFDYFISSGLDANIRSKITKYFEDYKFTQRNVI